MDGVCVDYAKDFGGFVSETTNKRIEMYVCPAPECTNYFGHTGMPDLSTEFTGPMVENKGKLEQETGSPHKHNRAECPDCRQRGLAVQRTRIVTIVPVPVTPNPTPALPGHR